MSRRVRDFSTGGNTTIREGYTPEVRPLGGSLSWKGAREMSRRVRDFSTGGNTTIREG